jgi:hypothetical protein
VDLGVAIDFAGGGLENLRAQAEQTQMYLTHRAVDLVGAHRDVIQNSHHLVVNRQ